MKTFLSFILSFVFMASFAGPLFAGALDELAGQSGNRHYRMQHQKPVNVAPAAPMPRESVESKKKHSEWLIMVYVAGVNNLGLFHEAENNLDEMEKGLSAGQDNVRFVVEYASMSGDNGVSFGNGTSTLLVVPDKTVGIKSQVIRTSPGADTGNVNTLSRFIHSVKQRFTADHTMLIIWNHGGGLKGIASDDLHGSGMSLKNLSSALKSLVSAYGKFDIIATDACLMQMLSIAYEFKDYADIIIGSQQPIPGPGYKYDSIAETLSASGGHSAEDVARIVVEQYERKYFSYPVDSKYGYAYPQLSAIRTKYLPDLKNSIDSWAYLMASDRNLMQKFNNSSFVNDKEGIYFMYHLKYSRDLVRMIEIINENGNPNDSVRVAGNDIRNFVENKLIIKNFSLSGREHGVSVYLPFLKYDASLYEPLQFAKDSYWGTFVRNVVQNKIDSW